MPGLTDLAVRSISAHELGDRCDAEVDPSAEMRIREVAELQVPAGIEAGPLAEGLDGVVVEAGPGVLPAVEVGHPVGNVHVDAVDARGRDLANSFHVLLTPGLGVGRDPDILVALPYPEGRAARERGGLARELPLKPVGMVLGEGVRALVAVLRDALGAGDVDEGTVPGSVGRFRQLPDRSELFLRIEEALVATSDVVVHLDAEHMAVRGLAHDGGGPLLRGAIAADPDAVCPVLWLGSGRNLWPGFEQQRPLEARRKLGARALAITPAQIARREQQAECHGCPQRHEHQRPGFVRPVPPAASWLADCD